MTSLPTLSHQIRTEHLWDVLTASGQEGLRSVLDSLSLHGNPDWTPVWPASSDGRCAADEFLTDLIYCFIFILSLSKTRTLDFLKVKKYIYFKAHSPLATRTVYIHPHLYLNLSCPCVQPKPGRTVFLPETYVDRASKTSVCCLEWIVNDASFSWRWKCSSHSPELKWNRANGSLLQCF